MTNYYRENTDAWKALARIDYFTHFVKAWIPFNAWYKNSYPDLESDAEIMRQIKTHHNSFRDRIVSLLENTDSDGMMFKENLSRLHYQLERNHIYNRGTRIEFGHIVVEENPVTIETREYRGFSYRVEIDANNRKRVTTMVTDIRQATRLSIAQNNGYDWNEIAEHTEYTRLPPECKRILRSCYDQVNPRRAVSVLAPDHTDAIRVGTYTFVNDQELIAKALITVLNNLRNSLFHGELVPASSAQLVYEPAYHLLSMLVLALN